MQYVVAIHTLIKYNHSCLITTFQNKMAKRITQETFDEVVRENMEEFDLSHEEALKDAVEQFTSQVCTEFYHILFSMYSPSKF